MNTNDVLDCVLKQQRKILRKLDSLSKLCDELTKKELKNVRKRKIKKTKEE